jgi:SAM-dependent methyltransferase
MEAGANTVTESHGVRRNARIHRATTHLPGPLRSAIRAIWHAWLHLLASRAWVRDFAIPITLTVLARLGVGFFAGDDTAALGSNPAIESAFDISVLIGTMMFVRWSITWGVPQMMANVRDIAAATQEPKREFLRELSTEDVANTRNIVRGLTSGGYVVQHPSELMPWFKRFFDKGGGDYVGVDSHGPGEYLSEFSWFLEVHAESLKDREHPENDKRVLTTPKPKLAQELRHRKPEYQSFFRWHPDHHVEIKWTDSQKAARLRAEFGIGQADVALWEKFAVLFEADAGGLKIQMWFPGEAERDGTTYERISTFVERILGTAIPLEKVAPGLDLVNRELAEDWENYVAPEARAKGGLNDFLHDALGGSRYVFDAAAGIGCDSVQLLRDGYYVTSNEVDELLCGQAEQYAASQGLKLAMTKLLWEDLPGELPGGIHFEAILCLGNSICLVDDPQSRIRCLQAFRETLVDGGLLVIDERNFQLMLDHARDIEVDPVANFPATTKGDVMYRGQNLRGYPAVIDRERRTIKWRFFRNSPPIVNRGELDQRQLRGPDLVLHAFAHAELFDGLRKAGFEEIDVYADLELKAEKASVMPAVETIGKADFITYVARSAPLHT